MYEYTCIAKTSILFDSVNSLFGEPHKHHYYLTLPFGTVLVSLKFGRLTKSQYTILNKRHSTFENYT